MSQANALRPRLDSTWVSVSLIAAKQSEKLLQFLLFSTTCTATAGNKANDSVGAMQSPFCCMRVSGFLISFCLSLVQCSIYFPINHVKKAIFKVKDGVLETQQHCGCVCVAMRAWWKLSVFAFTAEVTLCTAHLDAFCVFTMCPYIYTMPGLHHFVYMW